MTTYQVQVYGKPGCAKCKVLNERLDKLLAAEEWADVAKKYFSLDTEEGLIAFAEAECVNPQRIPAMLVARLDKETGHYEPIPNKQPGAPDETCKSAKLYQYLGLQTDYDRMGGVLTPKMLKAVLSEACS